MPLHNLHLKKNAKLPIILNRSELFVSLCLSLVTQGNFTVPFSSRVLGIHESLPSHSLSRLDGGSSCLITKVLTLYGFINCQCETHLQFEQHILPKGFVKMRHYGIPGNPNRKNLLFTLQKSPRSGGFAETENRPKSHYPFPVMGFFMPGISAIQLNVITRCLVLSVCQFHLCCQIFNYQLVLLSIANKSVS